MNPAPTERGKSSDDATVVVASAATHTTVYGIVPEGISGKDEAPYRSPYKYAGWDLKTVHDRVEDGRRECVSIIIVFFR